MSVEDKSGKRNPASELTIIAFAENFKKTGRLDILPLPPGQGATRPTPQSPLGPAPKIQR